MNQDSEHLSMFAFPFGMHCATNGNKVTVFLWVAVNVNETNKEEESSE